MSATPVIRRRHLPYCRGLVATALVFSACAVAAAGCGDGSDASSGISGRPADQAAPELRGTGAGGSDLPRSPRSGGTPVPGGAGSSDGAQTSGEVESRTPRADAVPPDDARADDAPAQDALPLPDLVLDAAYLADTVEIDRVTIDDMCLLRDGCVTGLGERRVLRFGSRTGNLGTADFVLGATEADNPYWTFNTCQQSYELAGFARYALTDAATGDSVALGAKSGFCIADAEEWKEGEAGSCDFYDCRYQGISRGCADNYGAALECQWVDVTGIPPGEYELEVTINADRQIDESDYANNVVRLTVTLDGEAVSVAH